MVPKFLSYFILNFQFNFLFCFGCTELRNPDLYGYIIAKKSFKFILRYQSIKWKLYFWGLHKKELNCQHDPLIQDFINTV